MASMFKLLSLILLLGLIFQVDADCSPFEPQGLDIVQSKTGKLIGGIPEWKVTITNDCRCSQSQVKLFCNGFRANIGVDPSILRLSGTVCLLNNGNAIHPSQTVEFFYALSSQIQFQLAYSEVDCKHA